MRDRIISSLCIGILVLAFSAGTPATSMAEDYYYRIEINGMLCGYAKLTTSPLPEGNRQLTLLTHEIVIRGTMLGAPIDSRITLTYHLDPATSAFTRHAAVIEQGSARMASSLRIEGPRAFVAGETPGTEEVVELPPDVVLDNTLFHPHLVADFAKAGAQTKTYRVFDGRDNAVREVSYTLKDREAVQLAGRTFDTLVLDMVDRRTGATARFWLDTASGIFVRTSQPGDRLSSLSDVSVVQEVARAAAAPNLDGAVMTRTNVAIPNPRAITYMKVRIVARPSGVWLSPEALNVPGQRFAGTVLDNAVDGVFEIEHRRYDGTSAPPFPPDFGADPALREFLAPEERIQSADPVLVAMAQEITAGSRDSWEAARRLSAWVSSNIKGAIPGGGTARGTFDQRAGECGGHSFLMAALARAVGIPARVVWGSTYTPRNGGEFGQHAWNEVFMGPAGWVPLDTTIRETDYVDSGHVRIGVLQSVATAFNATTMDILDHRLSGRAAPAANATTFEPFVGDYTNVDRGNTVKVLVKDGALTLEIPGRPALSFRGPDATGAWPSTVSEDVYATFDQGDAGAVTGMRLHQIVRMARTSATPTGPGVGTADLRRCLGTYLFAQARAEFTVTSDGKGLIVNDPLAKRETRLEPGASPGTWVDEDGKYTIRFDIDDRGAVTAMLFDAAAIFRKGPGQTSGPRTTER